MPKIRKKGNLRRVQCGKRKDTARVGARVEGQRIRRSCMHRSRYMRIADVCKRTSETKCRQFVGFPKREECAYSTQTSCEFEIQIWTKAFFVVGVYGDGGEKKEIKEYALRLALRQSSRENHVQVKFCPRNDLAVCLCQASRQAPLDFRALFTNGHGCCFARACSCIVNWVLPRRCLCGSFRNCKPRIIHRGCRKPLQNRAHVGAKKGRFFNAASFCSTR